MAELEFYDGAYSGQQIDAAIGKALSDAYFVPITIKRAATTVVQLANSGAYLCCIIGNAAQSQIVTILVGATGNVSHVAYGSSSAYTFEDGSGNGRLSITTANTNDRIAYFVSLNGRADPTIVT